MVLPKKQILGSDYQSEFTCQQRLLFEKMARNSSNNSVPFQGPLPGIATLASQIPDSFAPLETSSHRIPKNFYFTHPSIHTKNYQEALLLRNSYSAFDRPTQSLVESNVSHFPSVLSPTTLSRRDEACTWEPIIRPPEYDQRHFAETHTNQGASENSDEKPSSPNKIYEPAADYQNCKQEHSPKMDTAHLNSRKVNADKYQDEEDKFTISKRTKKVRTTRGRRTSSNSSIPCKICHQLYSRKDNLRAHQRVHSGEKPYSCSECSVQFRWLGALRSHQASHRRRTAAAERLAASSSNEHKLRVTSSPFPSRSPSHFLVQDCALVKNSKRRPSF